MANIDTSKKFGVPFNGTNRRLFAMRNVLIPLLEGGSDDETRAGVSPHAALEQHIQRDWSVALALVTSSPTSALRLALARCGAGHGRQVIVPALAPAYALDAIEQCGASPRIVDIETTTLTIDIGAARAATGEGSTAAIVAPYPYGQAPHLHALLDLAAEHGVAVIEEASAVPGCRYESGPCAGAAAGGVGAFGCLNLSYGEPLSSLGDVGLLVCRDRFQGEELQRLSAAVEGCRAQALTPSTRWWRTRRLHELDAACIHYKLAAMAGFQQRQRAIAARYEAAFTELEGLSFPLILPGWRFAGTCFPLDTTRAAWRRQLASELAARGVQTGTADPMFLPAHQDESQAADDLPVARSVVPRLLLLPSYAELEEHEVEHIIACVRRWHARCAGE